MRVLLTTSPEPKKSPFFCKEKGFPLGIGFLLAVLRQAGHDVHFIDNFLAPRQFWQEGFLEKEGIDFVGIYASTVCYKGTEEIIQGCDRLRRLGKWNGKIIVGGPHTSVTVSPLPESVDYVVRGEAEIAILDIVEGRVPPGIIYGERVEDLDSLPFPAYDIFAAHTPAYDNSVSCFQDNPVFNMNTSRGCPFSCRFCSVQGVWGRRYRLFSAERIVEDIKRLVREYDIRGVYFREDNFTCSLQRVTEFCEMLLRQDIRIKWLCESRVSPLPRETLSLMARAGCRWLYLGCESGSQRVLNLINKKITVNDIRNVISWSRELGIKCYTSWMVGIPGENDYERQMTYDLIEEIKPFSVGMHVFIGLPGSEMYEEMLEKGDYAYRDELGMLYSPNWNTLALRIDSYLAADKFCPVQSIPFKIYKNLMRGLLIAKRRYPRVRRGLEELSHLLPLRNPHNRILEYLDSQNRTV